MAAVAEVAVARAVDVVHVAVSTGHAALVGTAVGTPGHGTPGPLPRPAVALDCSR